MRMYVGNLSYNTGASQLRDLFAAFGDVVDATVISDKDTGRSKGFGFVEMREQQDGDDAIQALDGSNLDGRQIKVSVANERERRGGEGRADRRDKSARGW